MDGYRSRRFAFFSALISRFSVRWIGSVYTWRVGRPSRSSWSELVVDALAITSAAAGWNAHEHYDALYAPNDGHVSRTIANVVLNTICAARMPAARRHPSKKESRVYFFAHACREETCVSPREIL